MDCCTTHTLSLIFTKGRKSAKTTFHRQVSVSTFAGAVDCLCSPRFNVVAPSRYASRKTLTQIQAQEKTLLVLTLVGALTVFKPVPYLLNSYSWLWDDGLTTNTPATIQVSNTTTILIREYKYLERKRRKLVAGKKTWIYQIGVH